MIDNKDSYSIDALKIDAATKQHLFATTPWPFSLYNAFNIA
tara:strand:- start:378 stop:500 length:123 start_codon:yes stop_codon:yes gene_type:complete